MTNDSMMCTLCLFTEAKKAIGIWIATSGRLLYPDMFSIYSFDRHTHTVDYMQISPIIKRHVPVTNIYVTRISESEIISNANFLCSLHRFVQRSYLFVFSYYSFRRLRCLLLFYY